MDNFDKYMVILAASAVIGHAVRKLPIGKRLLIGMVLTGTFVLVSPDVLDISNTC
jgi:hypothetical protein